VWTRDIGAKGATLSVTRIRLRDDRKSSMNARTSDTARLASDPAARSPSIRWVHRLLATTTGPGPAIARIALGLVMFPHGAQKVLGWFGGHGFSATLGAFTDKMGIPTVFALLAFAAEFLGSIGLVVGALSRVAAFGIACTMVVAIFTVHLHNGLFMNWTGKQAGEGFEFHLLAIALAAVVMVEGAGAWSLDRWVTTRPSSRARL
jgi:putative oxidoreductase